MTIFGPCWPFKHSPSDTMGQTQAQELLLSIKAERFMNKQLFRSLLFIGLAILAFYTARARAANERIVVPPQAALSSCEEQSKVEQFLENFFMDYCMGPLVEPQSLRTTGAQMVYDLSRRAEFDEALNADTVTKQGLIANKVIGKYLKQHQKYYLHIIHPKMRFFYGEPSGIDGLTVGQHTVRTLNRYFEQKDRYKLEQMIRPNGVRDLNYLMAYTLAVHDVGRSIAFKTGQTSRLNLISLPYARTLLSTLINGNPFFTESEVRLALGLIAEQGSLTEYLSGTLSLTEATQRIQTRANIMNVDAKTYLQLLTLFNFSDSGIQTSLRSEADLNLLKALEQSLH